MASLGDIINPFWWVNVPEYELEGYWVCSITDDGIKNSIYVGQYMPFGFNNYIQSASIPQLTLDYNNSSFGLMNFGEKSAYDDVTLTFYDDVNGSCLGFFTDWLHTIYDEDNNCVKANWRYEAKTIKLQYYRELFTGVFSVTYYRMARCLPKSISEISAEEESGDRKTFSVTLSTQRVHTVTKKTKVDVDIMDKAENSIII